MTESATDNARLMTEHMNELNECFIQKKNKIFIAFPFLGGACNKITINLIYKLHK